MKPAGGYFRRDASSVSKKSVHVFAKFSFPPCNIQRRTCDRDAPVMHEPKLRHEPLLAARIIIILCGYWRFAWPITITLGSGFWVIGSVVSRQGRIAVPADRLWEPKIQPRQAHIFPPAFHCLADRPRFYTDVFTNDRSRNTFSFAILTAAGISRIVYIVRPINVLLSIVRRPALWLVVRDVVRVVWIPVVKPRRTGLQVTSQNNASQEESTNLCFNVLVL